MADKMFFKKIHYGDVIEAKFVAFGFGEGEKDDDDDEWWGL